MFMLHQAHAMKVLFEFTCTIVMVNGRPGVGESRMTDWIAFKGVHHKPGTKGEGTPTNLV